MQSLPKPPTTVLPPPWPSTVSLPPLPKIRSAPLPARMVSAPSLKSLPPTIVCAEVEAPVSIVSTPSLPNSCIEPLLPMMQSFSVPPFTVPILPAWRMTVSLPLSPVTVAEPVPSAMLSSPARPTIVPGPVSVLWFRTSLPAVPVILYAIGQISPVGAPARDAR